MGMVNLFQKVQKVVKGAIGVGTWCEICLGSEKKSEGSAAAVSECVYKPALGTPPETSN